MGKKKDDSDDRNQNHKDDEEEFNKSGGLFSMLSIIISWLFWITWSFLTFGLIFYVAVTGLMLYSTEFKMEIIFANRIRQPYFRNLSDCQSFGLAKCENIYINGNAGKLGGWFISPASKQYILKEAYILYLHGNMGSRGLDHRVQLYKRLTKMGYHILAIDYRGFGDSDGWPTEQGVVEDSKAAYKWLMGVAHGHACYVWGHSLGSAVAVQLGSWLNDERTRLNGMVLESPFNNLTDAIKLNHLAAPFFYMQPSFEKYLDDVRNVFRSSFWIQKVTSAILILHDESDNVLDITLARRLYLSAKEVGTTNVKMHEFDEKLYHNNIYSAHKLKQIIGDFIHFTAA